MKVLIRAQFSTFSGYGNDGIGMTRAFIRAGCDVYIEPTVVQTPLPEDVAMLMTKRLVAPFDLFIHHVDPMSLDATDEHKAGCDTLVGWSMWEWSDFGNMPKRSTLKKRLRDFELISWDVNVTL